MEPLQQAAATALATDMRLPRLHRRVILQTFTGAYSVVG